MRTRGRAGALIVGALIAAAGAGPAAAGHSVGHEAARLVEGDAGYRAVVRDLLAWHRTRHNGCVAFVATALRHVGVVVPDEKLDGPWSNPARLTFSLDAYLEREGWPRIGDPAALVAGDVVFTTGAPDHVMLFHGWADAGALVAVVSDNQRRAYRRPLRLEAGSDLVPFGFARRAPDDVEASVDLDDTPACADAIALRRRAGRAFARHPGPVTCRAVAGGAAALVFATGPDLDLPEAARLLVLDRRGRVRAARDLPANIDGYGGSDAPALLGAADLDGDGRLEVWTEQQGSSPMGSSSGGTIELWRERGRRLVAVGDTDGGWVHTTFDTASMGASEHWEPPTDPARQVVCAVTITPAPGALELRRTLTVGALVPAGERRACEPFERISFKPRRR